MPLCARCTGIYLGMFIAFSFYFFTKILKNKKPIKPPGTWINVLSISFILLMVVQAISSAFLNYAYENELRFITGILFGISLPWYLLITLNYSQRFKYENKEILNYKEYFILIFITLITVITFLFKIPTLLYISAYISTIGLLFFIFSINLTIIIIAFDAIKSLQKTSFLKLSISSLFFSVVEVIVLNLAHSTLL